MDDSNKWNINKQTSKCHNLYCTSSPLTHSETMPRPNILWQLTVIHWQPSTPILFKKIVGTASHSSFPPVFWRGTVLGNFRAFKMVATDNLELLLRLSPSKKESPYKGNWSLFYPFTSGIVFKLISFSFQYSNSLLFVYNPWILNSSMFHKIWNFVSGLESLYIFLVSSTYGILTFTNLFALLLASQESRIAWSFWTSVDTSWTSSETSGPKLLSPMLMPFWQKICQFDKGPLCSNKGRVLG